MTKRTYREFDAQTVMIVAEIIETAGEIHASREGFGTVRQCVRSSRQMVEPQAKRGIEPFNESGVDYAFPILSSFDQAFRHFFAALHNPLVNGQDTFRTLLDNLHNGDVWLLYRTKVV